MSRTFRNRPTWFLDETGRRQKRCAKHELWASVDHNCQTCCSQKFYRKLAGARPDRMKVSDRRRLESDG